MVAGDVPVGERIGDLTALECTMAVKRAPIRPRAFDWQRCKALTTGTSHPTPASQERQMRVLSGIQSSGQLHLGYYLGAT